MLLHVNLYCQETMNIMQGRKSAFLLYAPNVEDLHVLTVENGFGISHLVYAICKCVVIIAFNPFRTRI